MSEEVKIPSFLNFDYLKSAQFRVVHADGAYLALTTSGGMTVSFFSERQPIPRRIVHKVNADGTLGDEIGDQRVVRDAIIRDVEVAVTMSLEAAKRIRDKLDEMISRAEEITKQTPESRK